MKFKKSYPTEKKTVVLNKKPITLKLNTHLRVKAIHMFILHMMARGNIIKGKRVLRDLKYLFCHLNELFTVFKLRMELL